MLDEELRQRVALLASGDEDGLDEAAQEKILRRIAAEGPLLVRRGRRARWVMMAAGPALAAAAAVAIFAATRREPEGHAGVARGVPARAVTSVLACSSRAIVASHPEFVADSAGAHLDLGGVAFAKAGPGAVVRLAEASPCRTVISLESGTVTVHAKDLGGGELRVHATGGEVTVHGTIFAVTQTADSLAVEVAEGRVGVMDRVGEHTVVGGGRLLVSRVGAAQGALSTERTRALRAFVGAPEVVGFDALLPAQPTDVAEPARPSATQPPRAPTEPAAAEALAKEPSAAVALEEDAPRSPPPAGSGDLLARAEEARHAGDYAAARSLYRQAAEGSGPTAEAAWVAIARMELSLGHGALAREATKQRQERFGRGTLAPEALWIDVRAHRQTGDLVRARQLAEELVGRWPSSPQALAARQWLSAE